MKLFLIRLLFILLTALCVFYYLYYMNIHEGAKNKDKDFDKENNLTVDDDVKIMGNDYPYYRNIKATSQIGMSSKGSISQLVKNIGGLKEYMNLMVTGKSKASKTSGPLGNRYFIATLAKCNDKDTGEEQTRYLYINNKPLGNVPFLGGTKVGSFKGLAPGAVEKIGDVNPMALFESMAEGNTPECIPIKMETIDNENKKKNETRHVSTGDITYIDPCLFPDKKNPITKKNCNGFQNMEDNTTKNNTNNHGKKKKSKYNLHKLKTEKKIDYKNIVHSDPFNSSDFNNSSAFSEIKFTEVECNNKCKNTKNNMTFTDDILYFSFIGCMGLFTGYIGVNLYNKYVRKK